jgi:hypothetical protein
MEAGLAGLKIETDCANWPVAMFCDYDVRDVFAFGFRVIDVVAVDEHDDIRILLDTVVNYNIASYKVM